MTIQKGLFITVEGVEGAGKSTQLPLIRKLLELEGKTVLVTREPGGTVLGERIRELLLDPDAGVDIHPNAELLLMFAARAQHLYEVILPALNSGKTVLCDRFTDASFAYQGGGRGVHFGKIAALQTWLLGKMRPDLTLIFDIPVEQGLKRATDRGAPDRFERERVDFFERVRAAYLDRAKLRPRYRIIDGSQDLEAVEQQVRKTLRQFLDKRTHEAV